MSTVKLINEIIYICFSTGTFKFKVDQCYPIFHWSWNFWEMISLISFWKTSLAWSAGDGKSDNYQQQPNAAF